MACSTTALSAVTGCTEDAGGIVRSWYCLLSDITAVSLTSGVISNFTMTTTGLWKALVYDKDDTAYYNEVGGRANGNRYSVTQTAFLKFKGMSQAYVTAANASKDCCNIVCIHVYANGTRHVQGIELDSTATGGFVGSRLDTRITPSKYSDTGANQARLEYLIEGQANTLSTTTDLTDSEIAAL
jgi:hypothetical protein